MRYEVIKEFIDTQDKKKRYKIGDSYPQPVNKKISKDRLASLLSKNNKLGEPVIREVEEKKQDE